MTGTKVVGYTTSRVQWINAPRVQLLTPTHSAVQLFLPSAPARARPPNQSMLREMERFRQPSSATGGGRIVLVICLKGDFIPYC